ncbi:MAG: outer membrane lipid asymmetry maintenance protein MlaD [Leptospiraceae bacterium]|nr:outer membrane lipid asymmetry maintenance protein MlaD [Leptospiraceae bacterium]
MNKTKLHLYTGLFILAGLASFSWLALYMGDISLFGNSGYVISAKFSQISGLKEGAIVEVAGVQVGKVSKVTLDGSLAVVKMNIDDTVKIEEDSIASIRTKGLIGAKYVKITKGGMDLYLEPGGEIGETESAVDIEDLIGKFIYK